MYVSPPQLCVSHQYTVHIAHTTEYKCIQFPFIHSFSYVLFVCLFILFHFIYGWVYLHKLASKTKTAEPAFQIVSQRRLLYKIVKYNNKQKKILIIKAKTIHIIQNPIIRFWFGFLIVFTLAVYCCCYFCYALLLLLLLLYLPPLLLLQILFCVIIFDVNFFFCPTVLLPFFGLSFLLFFYFLVCNYLLITYSPFSPQSERMAGFWFFLMSAIFFNCSTKIC